jgi:hypothetical protein
MATIVTTVSQLLRAFNLPRSTPVVSGNNPYADRVPQGVDPDPAMYLSTLGTPVVADIVFQGDSYTDNDTGKIVTFADVTLVTVLITLTQTKRIIRTEIAGKNGSVKEYIGMDDYQIDIDGVITGTNGTYPFQEVAALHAMKKAPVTIGVVSAYLQLFDIFSLVVVDFSFNQEAGGYSKQNFTMSCLSDKPVELIVQ